jgi:hypothetical protein
MHFPNGITDADNQKEKSSRNEKSCHSDLFPVAVVQTPSRQHQKSNFSNSDASKDK